MKIRPLDNWKLLGTSIVMDVNRVYEAEDATNQPDWERLGLVFADVDGTGFLLNAKEYKFCDEYEVVVGNVGNVHCGHKKRVAISRFLDYVAESKSESGRAGGEEVTLFCNGEIMREYRPTIKWSVPIKDVASLLVSLKKYIADDYRCSEDPDDETPGMTVTIATTDGSEWAYQTGDNSYSGSCYHYRHWAVVYLYRNSNCMELAREAVSELRGMVAEEASR